MTYHSDGTYSERSGGLTVHGTYSVSDNRVTAIIPGFATTTSGFEIKGNELITRAVYAEVNGVDITSTVQSMTVTFTRQSGGDISQDESHADTVRSELTPSAAADWVAAKGGDQGIYHTDEAAISLVHYAAQEGRIDVLKLLLTQKHKIPRSSRRLLVMVEKKVVGIHFTLQLSTGSWR